MRSLEPSHSWRQNAEGGCQGRGGAGFQLGKRTVLDVGVGWLQAVSVPSAAELYPENGKSRAVHVLPQFNTIRQGRKESCRERTLERGRCTVGGKASDGSTLGRTTSAATCRPAGSPAAPQGPFQSGQPHLALPPPNTVLQGHPDAEPRESSHQQKPRGRPETA